MGEGGGALFNARPIKVFPSRIILLYVYIFFLLCTYGQNIKQLNYKGIKHLMKLLTFKKRIIMDCQIFVSWLFCSPVIRGRRQVQQLDKYISMNSSLLKQESLALRSWQWEYCMTCSTLVSWSHHTLSFRSIMINPFCSNVYLWPSSSLWYHNHSSTIYPPYES